MAFGGIYFVDIKCYPHLNRTPPPDACRLWDSAYFFAEGLPRTKTSFPLPTLLLLAPGD